MKNKQINNLKQLIYMNKTVNKPRDKTMNRKKRVQIIKNKKGKNKYIRK